MIRRLLLKTRSLPLIMNVSFSLTFGQNQKASTYEIAYIHERRNNKGASHEHFYDSYLSTFLSHRPRWRMETSYLPDRQLPDPLELHHHDFSSNLWFGRRCSRWFVLRRCSCPKGRTGPGSRDPRSFRRSRNRGTIPSSGSLKHPILWPETIGENLCRKTMAREAFPIDRHHRWQNHRRNLYPLKTHGEGGDPTSVFLFSEALKRTVYGIGS